MQDIRQIQKAQFALNFPSNFPSFKLKSTKAKILHSQNLADIIFSFAMPTTSEHSRVMSYPYFWKSPEHKEVK